MLFHPVFNIAQDGRDTAKAILKQLGSHHRNAGTRHHRFEDVFGGMDAAGERQVCLDASIQDGDPAERQAQVIGITQNEVRNDFEGFKVDIGLVEAVKEYQAFGSGIYQAFGYVGNGRQERT